MEESSADLIERELPQVVELARAGGAAALEFYGGPLVIERKGDKDEPVTQADHAANDIIVRGLRRAYPADGLLSKNPLTPASGSAPGVWIIDPLDGTSGFIDGNGDFAVQIGLAINGACALGVLYLPATDVLYWAVTGAGAWVVRPGTEAERLRVSAHTEVARMRLAASRSHRSSRMDRVVKEFGFREEIRRGSVGVKIGLIVERQCDIYIHLSPRTKQWDTCAPQIVLQEAGGVLTDVFGQPLEYNTPDTQNHNGLVASNGAAHSTVIAKLRPLLTEFGRVPVRKEDTEG
ncbi:MAG: 3'(2'),5'-bisphosphate nucleotidase CysQ [Pyrinomonadaceae bacterium]